MSFTMTFNGVELPITISDVGGRGPYTQEVIRTSVPGHQGSIYQKRRFPERPLSVSFSMKSTSMDQLRLDVDNINDILNVDHPCAVIFSDEQDKTYFAMADGEPDWNEIIDIGKGAIKFICFDPFKSGSSQTVALTDPLTIDGTYKTWPTVQVDFTAATSSFKVTNQDGKYVNVIYNVVAGDQLILDFAKRKITINGVTHMTALDWANSEWFALYPGNNTLTVTPNVATVQITYSPRWL